MPYYSPYLYAGGGVGLFAALARGNRFVFGGERGGHCCPPRRFYLIADQRIHGEEQVIFPGGRRDLPPRYPRFRRRSCHKSYQFPWPCRHGYSPRSLATLLGIADHACQATLVNLPWVMLRGPTVRRAPPPRRAGQGGKLHAQGLPGRSRPGHHAVAGG